MKKNRMNIKGDNNSAFIDINNSGIVNNSEIPKEKTSTIGWTIAGVVITLFGVIATLIIGWNNVLDFFSF